MKPNDEAYQAARAAILKAMAERNCIIAGVPFNENNYDEFDAGEAVEHSKVALDAAYAAQFPPSEDYAGLVKDLRTPLGRCLDMRRDAADALEAVLAERDASRERFEHFGELHRQEYDRICSERDALKAELDKAQDIARVQAERIGGYIKTIEDRDAERDALLARLAPVDDKELVEIGAKAMARPPFYQWEEMSDTNRQRTKMACRNAIAAVRPHIEAVERERCAKIVEGACTATNNPLIVKILHGNYQSPVDRDFKIAAAIRSGK